MSDKKSSGGMSREFTLIFLVQILFNLAASFAHPVTPTIIQNLHLHDYMFGLALAAMMFTQFLISPFWGKITDYLPSRVTMLIGGVGYGVAQIGFALSKTEGQIVAARMLAGLFVGAVFVSGTNYILNRSDKEHQGKYLTYYATIQTVGGAFGYLIGGFLGEISALAAFAAQSFCLILCGILFFFIMKPDNRHELSDISVPQLVKECNPFQAIIDSRYFLTFGFFLMFLVNIFVNLGNTGFDQAFNYYLKAQLNLTSSYNGIVKAGVGLVSFVANMSLCVWIIKKTDTKKSMAVLACMCTAAAAANVLTGSVPIFIVTAILLYSGYSVSLPVLQNMIANEAKPEQRNLVMGFYNSMKTLGSVIGSLSAGFLYSAHVKLPFGMAALAYGLAFVLLLAICAGMGQKKKQ